MQLNVTCRRALFAGSSTGPGAECRPLRAFGSVPPGVSGGYPPPEAQHQGRAMMNAFATQPTFTQPASQPVLRSCHRQLSRVS
jgi:hypothetical protein